MHEPLSIHLGQLHFGPVSNAGLLIVSHERLQFFDLLFGKTQVLGITKHAVGVLARTRQERRGDESICYLSHDCSIVRWGSNSLCTTDIWHRNYPLSPRIRDVLGRRIRYLSRSQRLSEPRQ